MTKNSTSESQIDMQIDDLMIEARNFLDGKPISNQGQADAIEKILDEMKVLRKQADQGRKDEKQPHLDAGRAIDARWKPVIQKADLTIDEAKKPLTAWRNMLLEIQRKREADARAEAERQAKIAAEKFQGASGMAEREEAEKAFKLAQKQTAKANTISRQPTGMRTYYEHEMADRGAFLNYMKANFPDDLTDFLNDYARKLVNQGVRSLPGVIVHERKKVA